jgi:hypothetical protein
VFSDALSASLDIGFYPGLGEVLSLLRNLLLIRQKPEVSIGLRRIAYGTQYGLGKQQRAAFSVFVLRQIHLSFSLKTGLEFARC